MECEIVKRRIIRSLILFSVAISMALGLSACQMKPGGLPAAKPTVGAEDPLFRVVQKNQWGFVDQRGRLIIKPQYAELPDAEALMNQLGFTPDTFTVASETIRIPASVMMDPAMSERIIQLQSSDILGFYFDFATQNGVFNRKRVPVGKFSQGRAAVNIDGKWGFIDTTGKMVIKPQFDRVDGFADGFAPVLKEGRWFYIDRNGEDVFQKKYDAAFGFRHGLARVRNMMDGKPKWNYIDTSGSDVLQTPLDYGGDFSEELAFAKVDGKVGYIDKKGNFQFTLEEVKLGGLFKADVAPVMNSESKWGFVNRSGEFVIQPLYDDADSFADGLAAVRMENRYGFIDPQGTLVISPQFNTVFPFSEGLAAVKVEDRWGYVNTVGEFVVEPIYEWAYSFKDKLAAVESENGLGYIDLTGRYVWQPAR